MERQTNDGTKAVAVLAIAHLSLLWTTSASSIGRLAVCIPILADHRRTARRPWGDRVCMVPEKRLCHVPSKRRAMRS